MKVTLTSTDKLVELNGVPARLWQGHTETGLEVHAFITRIAIAEDQDRTQFERELQVCVPPRPELAAYPRRLIL